VTSRARCWRCRRRRWTGCCRPAPRGELVTINEVYATLQSAVWSEHKSGQENEPMRRSLSLEPQAHLDEALATLTEALRATLTRS
jgi:hypothetical protein